MNSHFNIDALYCEFSLLYGSTCEFTLQRIAQTATVFVLIVVCKKDGSVSFQQAYCLLLAFINLNRLKLSVSSVTKVYDLVSGSLLVNHILSNA